MSRAAEPRCKISRTGLAWGLASLVIDHVSMSRVAAGLGVSWQTANEAVLAQAHRQLIADPHRFDGVRVIGVDEHVWRHSRRGDRYVTVIIDLTPVRDRRGPARLLDMVPGRSKQVFKQWLTARPHAWVERVETVAMDGFTGFKTAAQEEIPQAVTVMDPYHVVRLAGDALQRCRQRIQQAVMGHRGRAGDPLYGARRALLTSVQFLTGRQHDRLKRLFNDQRHLPVEATWGTYQDVITAYREKNRKLGRFYMSHIIDKLNQGLPKELIELGTLARTLKRRKDDILAYFDHPHTSNGPTQDH